MLCSTLLQGFSRELAKTAGLPHYLRDLQPGDVVSISTSKPKTEGRLSRLVERAGAVGTQAAQGSFTHTALYVGGGKVVEAVGPGKGVQLRPFSEALKNKSFLVHRPDLPKKSRDSAAKFAKKQVGKQYDTLALVVTGAGTVLPQWATHLIDKKVLKEPRKAEKFTCSNLVTAAYHGARLADTSESLTAPADLRLSDKLKTVKSRLKGKFEEKSPWRGSRIRGKWTPGSRA